jgi:hypothetical protein
MSANTIKNMGHSVNVRLKQLAQEQNVGFDYLLLRYAYERFLYRLGQSLRYHFAASTSFFLTPHPVS